MNGYCRAPWAHSHRAAGLANSLISRCRWRALKAPSASAMRPRNLRSIAFIFTRRMSLAAEAGAVILLSCQLHNKPVDSAEVARQFAHSACWPIGLQPGAYVTGSRGVATMTAEAAASPACRRGRVVPHVVFPAMRSLGLMLWVGHIHNKSIVLVLMFEMPKGGLSVREALSLVTARRCTGVRRQQTAYSPVISSAASYVTCCGRISAVRRRACSTISGGSCLGLAACRSIQVDDRKLDGKACEMTGTPQWETE